MKLKKADLIQLSLSLRLNVENIQNCNKICNIAKYYLKSKLLSSLEATSPAFMILHAIIFYKSLVADTN